MMTEEQKEELVINETNFSEYFRDCRTSRPERGDVIAQYMARAEFIDGHMKKDIIDLISNHDKAIAATNVMRKLGCATQKDAIRVCREICQDLASGMSPKEVEEKVYKYDMEMFFYSKTEFVPHWTIIGINNLDEFLDQGNQRLKMTTKIVKGDESKTEELDDD